MRLLIIGPGRAGGSLGLAALAAGHDVPAVVTGKTGSVPNALAEKVIEPSDINRVEVDLVILAVRDAEIESVARRLAGLRPKCAATVHLSGFTSVNALDVPDSSGASVLGRTGSFHPLQTLPDPQTGSEALAGAHVAITTTNAWLVEQLWEFAASLGMKPFMLNDDAKPAYHAAAACAANSVVEALAMAEDLFGRAGVDPSVAAPLTRRVVENVFQMGSEAALTGPVARGDMDTVRGHLREGDAISENTGRQLRFLTAALAIRSGRPDLADEILEGLADEILEGLADEILEG